MARRKGMTITEERRRLVRQLVTLGTDTTEIKRLLMQGVQLPSGRTSRVSEATARRDLAAVAQVFAGLFTDEDAILLEVGASFNRLKKIATDAAEAGQYHAAIRAEQALVKLATSQSDLWHPALRRRGPAGGDAEAPAVVVRVGDVDQDQLLAERLRELREKSGAELLRLNADLDDRLAHLRLVVDNTRDQAPAPPTTPPADGDGADGEAAATG